MTHPSLKVNYADVTKLLWRSGMLVRKTSMEDKSGKQQLVRYLPVGDNKAVETVSWTLTVRCVCISFKALFSHKANLTCFLGFGAV